MFELQEKQLIDILKKSVIEKNEEIIIDASKINLQEFAVLVYFFSIRGYDLEKYENGKAIFTKKSNIVNF